MSMGGGAKKWIFLAAGVCCFLLVLAITSVFRGAFAPEEEIVPSAPLEATPGTQYEPSEEPASEKWAVYVTGEVNFPGVYEIEPGGRVSDAIALAGGFSRRADREAINLAAKLRDEAHISVPAAGDTAPHREPSVAARAEKPEIFGTSAARGVNYPGGARDEKSGSKIDINKADASALSTLPGIGPKISAAIVAHREEHGPFADVEGLRSVKGIGGKRFEAIRDLVHTGN
jgi:competence protein ComEA